MLDLSRQPANEDWHRQRSLFRRPAGPKHELDSRLHFAPECRSDGLDCDRHDYFRPRIGSL